MPRGLKGFAGSILLVVAGVMAGAVTGLAATPQRASLTVVMDDNYPPYVFRNGAGQVVGYLPDLWHLWEQQTGTHVVLRAMDWDRAKQTFALGQADVIDTIFRTPEREVSMDFTPPYASLPVPIYADRHIGGLHSVASLEGFLVGVKRGDACVDQLKAGGGAANLRLFDSYEQIVRAAKAGGVRVFCMDEPPADYLLYREGIAQDYRKAFVLYTGRFHRAVHKGDFATLQSVEQGFDRIPAADMERLRDKWMGAPLAAPGWRPEVIYALGVAGAMVLLAALWVTALRRMVRQRTVQLSDEKQRLSTLLNTLPDLVWVRDAEGRYVTCNRAFERFVGLDRDAIVGQTDATVTGSEAAQARRDSDLAAARSTEPVVTEERISSADGHASALFEVVRTPMKDAAGDLAGVLAIARDITSYRTAQERLERVNRLHDMLMGVSDLIARTRDRDEIFRDVCRVAVERGGLRMAWVGVPSAMTFVIEPVARAGQGTDYLDHIRVVNRPEPLGLGPTGTAARTGHAAVCANVVADPLMTPWREQALQRGFHSLAAFPIAVDDRVEAVLTVYSDRTDFFDRDELELFERLVSQVGVALQAHAAEAARARAEAQLRASEERFARMFRTSPVGMALIRLSDWMIVDVNDAWARLFGYAPDQVLGHTGLDLDLWCDVSQRSAAFASAAAQDNVGPFDAQMRTRDRQVIDVAIAATRLEVDGQPFVLSSFTDISLRKQVARNLQEQAEELERLVAQRTAELNRIFDALPDLYFRLRRDGTILDFRAGRSEDLYTPPETFLNRRMQDVLPHDVGAVFDACLSAMSVEAKPREFEYSLTVSGGEETFEARMLPFQGDEFIVVVRNISDRHRLESERETALREKERLARLRSQFLANVSHEIRTPLNGIIGLVQLELPRSSGDARMALVRIRELSRQLLAIVNDVLDFSKIDANQMEVEDAPMDLREVLDQAVDTVSELARAKGLSVVQRVAADVPARVMGDLVRTRQILVNLLSNAVKFTSQGSIEASASAAGNRIRLRVADSGIGIPEEQLAQIFQPFRQADASTTRRFGGTGLGLSISKRLAVLMGGDILVTSQPGRGSTFELELPLRPCDVVAQADLQPQPSWEGRARRLQGLRILVAEDNEVNRLILEAALSAEGAAVRLVHDGRQAVDAATAQGQHFDLVLMDVQMPEMDGYTATREIHKKIPDLPVIGQTAHAMPDERARCLDAGMVAHVSKPIDIEQLIRLVLAFAA